MAENKFVAGSKWRMRGGEIATIYCAAIDGKVVAGWPGMASVFRIDGRYWFHDQESEYDLIEEIQRTAS